MTKGLQAWYISQEDFPAQGSAREKLEFCLHYAILAHSTYNTQPWQFSIDDHAVSVYADRRYGLPVLDPDDRQLLMSCAAATYNLRLAIRAFGYEEYTQYLPNPADEDLIARVQIGDRRDVSAEDAELFEAIPNRQMNRSAFKTKDVEQEKLGRLEQAAQEEGAWLHICDDEERAVIAHFIAEGDNEQMSRKPFRRELAVWNNIRRHKSGDGFPDYARSVKEMVNTGKPRILRRFEAAPGQVVPDDGILSGCPVLAILGSKRGGQVDRIYAGQAFMRILLMAEAMGLSVSTLNQPCEVPDLRLRLHDEIEHIHGRAQYILRIGYGEPVVNFSPRRPLSSFIDKEYHPEPLSGQGASPSKLRSYWHSFQKLFLAK